MRRGEEPARVSGLNREFPRWAGGVPISILCDNLKIAVARILGGGKRQRRQVYV